ncbi:MAG: NUDIX hydrolase [Patescibacteria group bacterium]
MAIKIVKEPITKRELLDIASEYKKEKQKVVVIALIRNEEGKILLQKRVDVLNLEANGKWEFPGGVVEFGEMPEQAVIRECQEEIGCKIKIVRLLPYLHAKVWERRDSEMVQVFVSCFEAQIVSGIPKASESEVSEVQWYTKEEVMTLDVLPGTNEFISLLTAPNQKGNTANSLA